MADSDAKLYLCNQCGMVLGVIMRGTNRRDQLNVLRNGAAVSVFSALGDVREINYVVRDLDQGIIVCSVCGAQREYHFSQQALDDLIERKRNRTYGLMDVV